ncbi:MAG: hypothetical protein D9V44_02110 [Actinobacteria bacterium]|nr:MAG: hypothetical protein D9V44_02110 [Actinomycetota bacterium]
MRRLTAWALVVGVLALAVLAYFGNAWLFALYLAALGNAIAFHWWYACSRCSNLCCQFNVRSSEYFLRSRAVRMVGEREREFSDIRSLVAAIPLLLSVLIGVVGAWMFHWIAAVLWLGYMAVAGYSYWSRSCTRCGNDCPANTNPAYRAWKQGPG